MRSLGNRLTLPRARRPLPRTTLAAPRAISHARLTVWPLPENERPPPPKLETLAFGRAFAPHMLQVRFKEGAWQAPEIAPFRDLTLSPAAAALHYGLECFEGMKAYRCETAHAGEGDAPDLRLFRPDLNMARLKTSMERLAMPGADFDSQELIRCIGALVRVDQAFVPPGKGGYSLYIRPTVIATHPFLGLSPPEEVLLYAITSPVGPYFAGLTPVRLTADIPHVRAWPGGAGSSKVGGNYAPTIGPGAAARTQGYDQVLWLCGADDEVTEVGAMNVFFVVDTTKDGATRRELVTPPLDGGLILPGVTRQSILELVRKWGEIDVVERSITMPEVSKMAAEGQLIETFCAGTAAVVTPISQIQYQGKDIEIPATGKVTKRVFSDLMGIQYGKIEGPYGWSVKV